MSEKETYYYTVYYVDGKTQTFTRNDDALTSLLKDANRDRIIIDDTIINVSNVVRVVIETQTQREEQEKEKDKKTEENFEALSKINF